MQGYIRELYFFHLTETNLGNSKNHRKYEEIELSLRYVNILEVTDYLLKILTSLKLRRDDIMYFF